MTASRFLFSALLSLLPFCSVYAQSFRGLGDLPGGSANSTAQAVSADGSVVVGSSSSVSGNEAFRWTADNGVVGLGDLPGGDFLSTATNVSGDGNVIVGYGAGTDGEEAFRWTATGGMVGLGDQFGDAYSSFAIGVSDDGAVVVGSHTGPTGKEAFRWTAAGGAVGLGDLPEGFVGSEAIRASADGSVVVGYGHSADGLEAFRWTAGGGMVGLGDVAGGSFGSWATDVSDDGAVVVGRGRGVNGYEAFRWTPGGGMVGLGNLPGGGFHSEAWGVSADGNTIVGYGVGANGWEAFIWTPFRGMRSIRTVLEEDYSLDLTGWTLDGARDISADGTVIVGYGTNPEGRREAWRAELGGATWLDPVSGFFNEPTRWSISDIPGEHDGVRFNVYTTSSYTVTLIQDQTTETVTVDSSDVRLDLGGATYTVAQTTGTGLRIGIRQDRFGALAVLGGTLAAEHAVVGEGPGSDGALALGLFGDAATLELNGIAEVGRGGEGDFSLHSGSQATVRRGLWIGAEEESSGTVSVGAGGLLQVTEGADGTLIGNGGTGSLSADGGTVSLVGTVNVGSSPSGNGTFKLESGASGTTHNMLQVGVAGIGGLEVTDGSALTSADVILGLQPGSFGTALVDGLDSRWEIANSSRIGVAGAALLQIQNGATVCFNGLDHHVGAQGTVQIFGNLVVSGTGCPPSTMNGKRSTPGGALLTTTGLFLDDGAVLEADTLRLDAGGILGGDATVDLTITNAGTLAPGGKDAAGILPLANDYAQAASGFLEIEFGGITPGTDYDQLAVAGAASLDGTLRLDRIAGYTPMIGDAYTLLTAASVAGTFSTIDQPADVAFDVTYTTTEVIATVAAVNVSNDADPNAALPQTFALNAAYPNPFDTQVTIPFELSEAGPVFLAVYDLLGREVAQLANETLPAGYHEAVLNGKELTSGVYLVRITAGRFSQTRRITLLR